MKLLVKIAESNLGAVFMAALVAGIVYLFSKGIIQEIVSQFTLIMGW